MTHHITTPDNRTLAFRTFGDEDGRPVVFCHAAPGSSAFDPDPSITEAAGIRLIVPDRPGYGDSTQTDGVPTIKSAAGDVTTLLDHLGIDAAPAVGWSAGGRVALAASIASPDRITRVATVGTPAPHEEVPWIPAEQAAMLQEMQPDPADAVAQLTDIFTGMITDPQARRSMLAGVPADQMLLASDDDLAARVDTMLAAAFAQGAVGLACDIISYTIVPWGFEPQSVTVPTINFSGSDDVGVPPAHGAWYTEQIAESRHQVIPGAGHLVAATSWAEIVAAVLD